MPLTKRALAGLIPLACSALMGIASPAFAQPYPNRQVTIVVPIGPGTEVDWSARAYAQKLADMWRRAAEYCDRRQHPPMTPNAPRPSTDIKP